MKRRQFVERLGIGSAVGLGSAVLAASGVARAHDEDDRQEDQEHEHRPLNGPLASATVSFGAWPVGTAEVPVDRLDPSMAFAPIAPNVHALLPQVATIKQGGSVNFVIAGFHQIVVYAPGKKPSDVDTSSLLPIPMAPDDVGLIDDPGGRIYRGLDPRAISPPPPGAPNLLFQDRVEVVGFSKRGLYLVICSVNVHFADGMYGWVRVIR
jgi:hypothetical protein